MSRVNQPGLKRELFTALTKDFIANGFDVKRLVRTIMNSGVYQLSSDANATQSERQQVLFEVHRQATLGEALLTRWPR